MDLVVTRSDWLTGETRATFACALADTPDAFAATWAREAVLADGDWQAQLADAA